MGHGEIGETYSAGTILHDENERGVSGDFGRRALVVECAQADPVFLEAVR